MKNSSIILDNLSHFRGSETFYRHHIGSLSLIYTEGVLYLTDSTKCFWLLDLILSYQSYSKLRKEKFQVWTVAVNENSSCLIACYNGNDKHIISQQMPFTNFPLGEIKLWLVNGVLMLPSEY